MGPSVSAPRIPPPSATRLLFGQLLRYLKYRKCFLFLKYINHFLVWQKFPKEEEVQLLELILSALRLDYSKSMTLDLSLSLLVTSILAYTDAAALMTLGARQQAVMFYPSLYCKRKALIFQPCSQ